MHSFMVRRFGGRWRQDCQIVLGGEAPRWLKHNPSKVPRYDALAAFEAKIVKLGFDPTVERKFSE